MTKMGVRTSPPTCGSTSSTGPPVGLKMGPLGDLVMDYTDYGKAVTIETPPTAETLDFAKMLEDLKDLKGLEGTTTGT
ncbi:hypothetical protein NKG94_26245 [Micromonospora sp. M12]